MSWDRNTRKAVEAAEASACAENSTPDPRGRRQVCRVACTPVLRLTRPASLHFLLMTHWQRVLVPPLTAGVSMRHAEWSSG